MTLTPGTCRGVDVGPDGKFLINITVGDAVTAPIGVGSALAGGGKK